MSRKQAQEALQELSAFVKLASLDPSHAPTMSDEARMATINSIAPFLDDVDEEAWIRETVENVRRDMKFRGGWNDHAVEEVLRSRLHLLRKGSEHVR